MSGAPTKRDIAELRLRAGPATTQELMAVTGWHYVTASSRLAKWREQGDVEPAGFQHVKRTRGGPARLLWRWAA